MYLVLIYAFPVGMHLLYRVPKGQQMQCQTRKLNAASVDEERSRKERSCPKTEDAEDRREDQLR